MNDPVRFDFADVAAFSALLDRALAETPVFQLRPSGVSPSPGPRERPNPGTHSFCRRSWSLSRFFRLFR
jgi:hypothetical protein